jgi:hypothetical protein
MDLNEEKTKRAERRRHRMRVTKRREELAKAAGVEDRLEAEHLAQTGKAGRALADKRNEDCDKHTIKRIGRNPRRSGIKTKQELIAEEAFDTGLEDAGLISDAAAVEFLVDEALRKAQE